MKRWLLIFVATVLVSKFMASTMLKLMPETSQEIHEMIAKLPVFKTFAKESATQIKVKAPKTFVPSKAYLAYTKSAPLIIPPTKKQAPLIKTAQEEKARRKKRKKKLEEAANAKKKGPELTVMKVAGSNDKKLDYSAVSITTTDLSFTSDDKKPNPIAPTPPLTSKISLADWAARLTQHPNSSDLKAFLSLYKSGQITSHDYYSVLALMQKSSVKEARRLSVVGSSVEPNPDAFQILVHEKYSEKETDIQTLAVTRLAVYKDVKYLSSLTQPLTSGDVFAKTEASDILGQIAQGLASTPQSVTADVKQWFTKFVVILTPLSKDVGQATLQASATHALTALRTILG